MRAQLVPILAAVLAERNTASVAADEAAARALALAGDPAAEADETSHRLYAAIAQRLTRAADEVRAAVQEIDYRDRNLAALAQVTTDRMRITALEEELRGTRDAMVTADAARAQLTAEASALTAAAAAHEAAKVDARG